jgi:uncharacterized RmlC-like cupin family protein
MPAAGLASKRVMVLKISPTNKPVRAVIARTDPNEQESVVLLK